MAHSPEKPQPRAPAAPAGEGEAAGARLCELVQAGVAGPAAHGAHGARHGSASPRAMCWPPPAASLAKKVRCAPCVGLASPFYDMCVPLICSSCGGSKEDVTLTHGLWGTGEARSERQSQTKQRRNPEEPETMRNKREPCSTSPMRKDVSKGGAPEMVNARTEVQSSVGGGETTAEQLRGGAVTRARPAA